MTVRDLNRVADWESQLNLYLAEHRHVIFEYGTHDCALFVSDAVNVMTGFDPASLFRGKYNSKIGSLRALKKYGQGDLETTFDAILPARELAFCLRGDVVFDGDAVGICIGDRALFVGQENEREGLLLVDMKLMKKAWAV